MNSCQQSDYQEVKRLFSFEGRVKRDPVLLQLQPVLKEKHQVSHSHITEKNPNICGNLANTMILTNTVLLVLKKTL